MMTTRLWGVCAFVLVAGLMALHGPCYSGGNSYVEDFSTREYCDTVNTTALWDTVAGELKLPPFELTLEGSCDTPGLAWGVCISGDYVYVADGASGLGVIDISDPVSPALAGNYNTSGYAYGVTLSGDYAYVADGASGLAVIDISDPTSPTLGGNYDTPGPALGVVISGNYAYVADGVSGLTVIDISDPTSPTLAGNYNTPDYAYAVAVSGDYAYVADGHTGLQVIDISDPTTPTLAGNYNTPDYAYAVAISGDYAYVADELSGLQIIDISDPTTPTLAGNYDTPDYAWGVAISGDYAYVADGTSGLQVVDISDPTTPESVGDCNTPGTAHGVAISGDCAYVADDLAGLQVIKIAEPTLPPMPAGGYTSVYGYSVAASGDYAYVTDGFDFLCVTDISDPVNPTYAGRYIFQGESNAVDVAISGDYAYVTGDSLWVLDILSPASPNLVGGRTLTASASAIALSGDYAYLAGDSLWVLDISDPTAPSWAGACDIPGSGSGLAISGDYAYVPDGFDFLSVMDISDPLNPANAGGYSFNMGSNAVDIAISGDYAYVTGDSLWVLNILSPASPNRIGGCSLSDSASAVALSGDYAFLAGDSLWVLDIRDPANPAVIGSYGGGGCFNDVVLAGDYAYTAWGGWGLQVMEVFHRRTRHEANIAQSLPVEGSDATIVSARLLRPPGNNINWELSANGGTSWQDFAADSTWQSITVPGSSLLWRATLVYQAYQPTMNPTCTDLEIEWLGIVPFIDSISDIPNDQGRQVSISWARSDYDRGDSPTPITEYSVFRRIDPISEPPGTRGGRAAVPGKLTEGDWPHAAYPPGEWHYVMSVPAYCEDSYAVVVPTLVDSTASEGTQYSVFFIRAGTDTPSVYYDSDPDSGYSVDNLAPAPPPNLRMASAVEVAWDESEAEDFNYFTLYGSSYPDLDSTATLVGYTAGTNMDVTDDQYDYYHVTATDFSGNEGDASSVENTYSEVRLDRDLPTAYALKPNRPNPFALETAIRFDLPEECKVRLEVFDICGREVLVLAEGEYPAGRHSVTWAGVDTRGKTVVPGIYFVRIEAGAFSRTGKMVLMR